MMPKFPHVQVALIGQNGNTGAIMGRVAQAMTDAEVDIRHIREFRLEVFDCESYAAVLRLVQETVTVEGIPYG